MSDDRLAFGVCVALARMNSGVSKSKEGTDLAGISSVPLRNCNVLHRYNHRHAVCVHARVCSRSDNSLVYIGNELWVS